MSDVYRIRWHMVATGKGSVTRMCIAERLIRVLGVPVLWWPVRGAEWRHREARAEVDIENEVERRRPKLPEPTYFEADDEAFDPERPRGNRDATRDDVVPLRPAPAYAEPSCLPRAVLASALRRADELKKTLRNQSKGIDDETAKGYVLVIGRQGKDQADAVPAHLQRHEDLPPRRRPRLHLAGPAAQELPDRRPLRHGRRPRPLPYLRSRRRRRRQP